MCDVIFEKVYIFSPLIPADKSDTFANNVDPDETWWAASSGFTLFATVFDFRLKPLLHQRTSKLKDRRVHFSNHHENMPIWIWPPSTPFSIVKLGFTGVYIIFLILLNNIDCGYSLEPPHRGGSNEYPQSMFWAEIWKISGFISENICVFGGEIFYMFE